MGTHASSFIAQARVLDPVTFRSDPWRCWSTASSKVDPKRGASICNARSSGRARAKKAPRRPRNGHCGAACGLHRRQEAPPRGRVTVVQPVVYIAYHSTVFRNPPHFRGKVVLDVGTGSGNLAIWSAQAGARKVYAVEATNVVEHTRKLVRANGVADIVEVIQGTMEDIVLPEKVDVIISEWMGYYLLRESMFHSVISTRDRWLNPRWCNVDID
ncbi:protein arginine N-methyltransferase PRMT10-like [Aegilops tauschii subsp. strangulata]|uniref:protein arginine N-methyltransferase PRMT10-like n=1 Tax=Aegilops tauschii subsp. strangulata TaxID=200361 RepID=UPI003CC88A4B